MKLEAVHTNFEKPNEFEFVEKESKIDLQNRGGQEYMHRQIMAADVLRFNPFY